MIILFLTCANKKEADKIALTLLKKRLIVCAKSMAVSSSSIWKGKIESAREILLIMESHESLFDKIEKEVRKIHSYETFVLLSFPITHTSKGTREWINSSLINAPDML